WIPELVHNEAFRQKALLLVRDELRGRLGDGKEWRIASKEVDADALGCDFPPARAAQKNKLRLQAVNLPGFRGVLSRFTQPGKMFADEISDRLKVIACLEKPNMLHSESLEPAAGGDFFPALAKALKAGADDAQMLFWAADDDVKTALETIEERCRLAFQGVPNETRKGLDDGRTIFERVLPGPDRMYPDTDSAPIPVEEELIERVRAAMPPEVSRRLEQFRAWGVPADTFTFLLKHNLAPLLEKISAGFGVEPRFAATVLGHLLKNLLGRQSPHRSLSEPAAGFSFQRLYDLFGFIQEQKLDKEIVKVMLPVVFANPNMDFQSVLTTVEFQKLSPDQVLAPLSVLQEKFRTIATSKDPAAAGRWIAGNLRKRALGNMPMRDVAARLAKGEKP
ncbi:MAG TPA: Glu-tRNA(Gln) amidotransferase GatDE subunit E, partial [Acidobacteriota bacterium]